MVTIAAVNILTSMRQDALDIPDHLRDALWRAESAQLEPSECSAVMVCGVGGSAIGGELAQVVLGDRLTRPVMSVRDYVLPSWVDGEAAVLCSSFSGTTEEAIACFEAAGILGCRRVVASTGGPLTEAARAAGDPVIGLPGILRAPRAAVGYMVVVTLEVAARCGAAPRLTEEIESAAEELTAQRESIAAEAAEIAALIGPATPVIHGAGLTAPVARRWKAQINENAKRPAFFSELPEANHNEICAWGIPVADGLGNPPVDEATARRLGDPAAGETAAGRPLAAILVEDIEQHPRTRLRFELTAELLAETGSPVWRTETRGTTRLARLMSAVMLGDLLSLDLAARDGIDPLPIGAIDRLKERLA